MSVAGSARVLRLLLQRAACQPASACGALGMAAQQLGSLGQWVGAAAGTATGSQASRSISTSRAFFMSGGLPQVLADELAFEKKEYAKPEAVAHGPPAPFTLTDTPGDTLLSLSRSYGSGEQVSVDLHVNNQPSADQDMQDVDDTSDELLNTVVFNVHITKGDTSLVFECESDGTFVGINHVSHEPKDGAASESMYTGPVFDELDERVQEEFRAYLEERGITVELGEYLRHLVYDKEMREYMRWLQNVAEFVGKK